MVTRVTAETNNDLRDTEDCTLTNIKYFVETKVNQLWQDLLNNELRIEHRYD